MSVCRPCCWLCQLSDCGSATWGSWAAATMWRRRATPTAAGTTTTTARARRWMRALCRRRRRICCSTRRAASVCAGCVRHVAPTARRRQWQVPPQGRAARHAVCRRQHGRLRRPRRVARRQPGDGLRGGVAALCCRAAIILLPMSCPFKQQAPTTAGFACMTDHTRTAKPPRMCFVRH